MSENSTASHGSCTRFDVLVQRLAPGLRKLALTLCDDEDVVGIYLKDALDSARPCWPPAKGCPSAKTFKALVRRHLLVPFVTAARRGSVDATRILLEYLQPRFLKRARSGVGLEAAKDCVQNTLELVARYVTKLVAPLAFEAHANRILRCQISQHFNPRKKRVNEVPLDDHVQEPSAPMREIDDEPVVRRVLEAYAIHRQAGCSDSHCKDSKKVAAFDLNAAGVPQNVIAARLGLRVNTVKTWVRRKRLHLAQVLGVDLDSLEVVDRGARLP